MAASTQPQIFRSSDSTLLPSENQPAMSADANRPTSYWSASNRIQSGQTSSAWVPADSQGPGVQAPPSGRFGPEHADDDNKLGERRKSTGDMFSFSGFGMSLFDMPPAAHDEFSEGGVDNAQDTEHLVNLGGSSSSTVRHARPGARGTTPPPIPSTTTNLPRTASAPVGDAFFQDIFDGSTPMLSTPPFPSYRSAAPAGAPFFSCI
eukprot:Rmarinus@m.8330